MTYANQLPSYFKTSKTILELYQTNSVPRMHRNIVCSMRDGMSYNHPVLPRSCLDDIISKENKNKGNMDGSN
jgi:hypothetical protein